MKMTDDEDVTAYKFPIDIYPDDFEDFDFLCSQIDDRAYEFVLRMEEHVGADQLGDVVYDEEDLRIAYDDDKDRISLELIVEIHSDEYAADVDDLLEEDSRNGQSSEKTTDVDKLAEEA